MSQFKRRLESVEKRVNVARRPAARIVFYDPGEEPRVPEDDGREYLATVFLPRNGRETSPQPWRLSEKETPMSIKSRLAELELRAAARAETGSAIQKVLAASVPAEVWPRFVAVAKRALAREPISEEERAFLRPYQKRLRAGLASALAGRGG